MFRLIAILSLILAVVVFVVGLRRRRASESAGGAPKRRPLTWVERGLYLIMVVGIIGAALTGLGMVITTGHHLEGWGLMIHCAIAPAFAVGMAGVALTFADRYCFRDCCPRPTDPATTTAAKPCCPGIWDAMFWAMLVAGLIVILTAILPMTGWEQHWQHTLLYLHKWSSLALAVLTIMHASRVVRA
jgi:hypothetical protein